MLKVQRERGRFAALLTAQILLMGTTPFVSDSGAGELFLTLSVMTMVAAGVWAATGRRGLLRASLVLLVLTALAWLGPDVIDPVVDDALRLTSAALFFALTAAVVVAAVVRHRRVTTDTILGGINAYLLIAFTFMMIHTLIMVLDPTAYTLGGLPLHETLRQSPDSRGFATMLYFSFTTITTLGYGDVVPTAAVARLATSAEAVVGQLFVAIFIGRLVSLEVSARFARHDDGVGSGG